MLIFPAIDMLGGQCVRLFQGDYSQETVYANDPVAMAQTLENAGFTHLHLVDLEGAKAKKVIHWNQVEGILKRTRLIVDFGGGIRNREEVERLFELGVDKVNIGSLAYREPELFTSWIEVFGADRIILSADVRDNYIATHGWQATESTLLSDYIADMESRGINWLTVTDISKDGAMSGPATELYRSVCQTFPGQKLIASGGIRNLDDVMAVDDAGCRGAIIGKAIYEKTIDLTALVQLQTS
ncbi:MAG TPA: 1-(5-phosphoribosyl)-5-[(5-phosphoribosylamino)methylideneamino]imidazole-4-carboxamide isomerase [Saprospiraceae bacterium]|nr:1-(5-phosphoribosyl)-5-[(5-phosphoribosylamino)methylideneamino]imidazole-4-carboxamide isomerase [Saprospiraceae bacterium]HPG08370.1 1-(5-phosphoribosyl)-5-[(5-phosphoribosylamino)methylideneamino]imidazole-4-carboxamide isomerase [Saprospiraceae bacterium]HRV87243.1 1-(5-phosphoribosyl)-5-[(5-phosphoribosylamino)methylideneamino]imidazole-4-carboxamide isomerase [Saprospiraceae bacterium]